MLGISFDDPEDNRTFKQSNGFTFPLLSDTERKIGTAYHAGLPGGISPVPRRITYLIDPEGKIARWYKVRDVRAHPDEVISDLDELAHESLD